MRRLLILAVLLVLALSGLIGCASGNGEGPRTGSKAPNFTLTRLDGQKVTLSALKGKPILLNFWTTTCPSCRLEMPYLQMAYDEWTGKGLVLFAIDIGEDPGTIKEFLTRYNLTLPVLLDTNQEVAGKYNVEFIPATYFIDRDGIIQARVVGAFPSKGAIDRYIQNLMK